MRGPTEALTGRKVIVDDQAVTIDEFCCVLPLVIVALPAAAIPTATVLHKSSSKCQHVMVMQGGEVIR